MGAYEALLQERFTPGRLPPAAHNHPPIAPRPPTTTPQSPPDPAVVHDRREVLLGGDPGRCQHTWPSTVLSRADGTYRQHRCGNNPRHTNTCVCRYCGDPRDGRAPT